MVETVNIAATNIIQYVTQNTIFIEENLHLLILATKTESCSF